MRWRDSTAQEAQEGITARETKLQQEQELMIAVHAREYDTALQLALRLKQPRALRTVLEQLLQMSDGDATLRSAVAGMDDEEVLTCLQTARDWNTTAQHSLVAQRLLHALLKVRALSLSLLSQTRSMLGVAPACPQPDLAAEIWPGSGGCMTAIWTPSGTDVAPIWPGSHASRALSQARPVARLTATPQMQSLLEAFLPYSERHFDRLDRLVQGAHLLSYTLSEMKVLSESHAGQALSESHAGQALSESHAGQEEPAAPAAAEVATKRRGAKGKRQRV